MAAAGDKPAYSNRLASMGFMKRASGSGHSTTQATTDKARAQSHAAASTSEPSLRQQHQQQQKQASEPSSANNQQQQDKRSKHQLSDKLTSMKFMQRAQPQKRGFDEAIGQEDAAKAAAEWTAPAAAKPSRGCVIIQERDPLPAGVCGRMSFGKFNPDTELLQAQAEAIATGKPLPSAGDGSGSGQDGAAGVSVTDDDMAAGWGKGRGVLSSLRMQRTHKRQKVH